MNRSSTIAAVAVLLLASTAARAQTTLNLSQDLVPLGIAATNMGPNQPALDSGPLFMAGVNYAKAHGMTAVVADKGAYYFLSVWNVPNSNTHVWVSGIDNMTIDLHGSDLVFTHPTYYGIIVSTSVNAALQNFTVDYQPLPFTQVRVVSVDIPNSQIQYAVESGWPNPSVFNSMQVPPGYGVAMEIHVFRNGQPAAGTRRMSTQLPFTGDRFPVTGNTAPPTLTAVRPGDVVVLNMRGSPDAVNATHCTGCTLRNITVYAAGGGSAVGMIASQSNVIERIYAMPKPGTDRLVSTVSAIAVGASGPNNQIRLSRSIRSMDDAFWFYTWSVGTVQSQLGARSLSVAATTAWTTLAYGIPVPNGSPVSFQRLSDGIVLGNAVIVSQTAPATTPPFQATFNFDRDLPGNLAGAIMNPTDANLNGANSVIERSTSQSHSLNGGGIASYGLVNSAFRGNYIRQSAYYGVFLVQVMASGLANPPWVDLSIANNVIDGTNMTSDGWWFEMGAIYATTLTSGFELMTQSVFSNPNVTNNFVADAGRSAVWIGNTTGGIVTGNYLLDPNSRPDPTNTYRPDIDKDAVVPLVIRSSSSGVTTSNNTIDTTSGRLRLTDSQYNELAAYAPGGIVRLNAYHIGSLPSPTLSLTDADGITAPLTIQSTAAHALDVQLPAGAALGGAYITLTSGGAKYFSTLFVDSQDNVPALNGCTYQVSPAPGPAVASASILVVTQAGCVYQIADADPFVTVASSGTGTGIVTLMLSANGPLARTTTVEIAGQPVTVTQAGAARSIVAGGRARFDLANASAENWTTIEAVAGRSYCAQLAAAPDAQAGATATLTAFRADATTVLVAGTPGARRVCVVAPATEALLVKVTQADATPRSHMLAVTETTLWANWFYIGGSYSSYTLLRNTTESAVNTTITWRADTGGVVGTRTVAIPPREVVSYDARATTNGTATAGSVEVAHDGEPQALVGSQTTLSATGGLSFDTITMQRRQR